jgi:hypothetical protein
LNPTGITSPARSLSKRFHPSRGCRFTVAVRSQPPSLFFALLLYPKLPPW